MSHIQYTAHHGPQEIQSRRAGYIKRVLRLSFSLAKTNFKLRNEGSYLGLLWYILSPLALFLIILFVKEQTFQAIRIPYYPIYLLSGLLIFHLFTQTVTLSITAISSNAGFIKSIKIPMESLVLSRVIQFVFSHAFELVLLAVCLFWVGLPISGILFYIPVFIVFILFVTGVSLIIATLGVYILDLANIWTVVSQLLFFLTPIFYLPKEGTMLYALNQYNPLYYVMRLAREALISGQFISIEDFLISCTYSVIMLLIGLYIFHTYKARFAEYV